MSQFYTFVKHFVASRKDKTLDEQVNRYHQDLLGFINATPVEEQLESYYAIKSMQYRVATYETSFYSLVILYEVFDKDLYEYMMGEKQQRTR